MAKGNRTDSIYWLEKIFEALGGDPSSVDTSKIKRTDEPFWLEQISKVLSPKSVTVTNITELTNEQLDGLQAGDQVIKVTGNQKHLYLVNYKGEGAGEGICLTYDDATYCETVSYDRTESGWEYNSTDTRTYINAEEPTS